MRHQEFDLPGVDPLFAQSWAPTDGATAAVGIVHGLGDHSGRYAVLAESLVAAGYRVVAFDQRGHGRSGGRRGDAASYDLLLSDLDRLVAALRSPDATTPQFLYGHSLGGNLVLNYALRRPSKLTGVVASSPLLLPTRPPPTWKRLLGRSLRYVWPHFLFRIGLPAESLSHDPAAVAAYRADPLIHDWVSARLAVPMLAAGRWALAHAQELRLATLLLHGTADAVTSCEASGEFARRAGENCTLRAWPGLFHELHWEYERNEVLGCVLAWMQAQLDGRAPST